MSKLRAMFEDALAATHQRALNAAFRSHLAYDDRYEGQHLSLHAHHPADGDCAWNVALLDAGGAYVTLYAESAAAAARMFDAIAHGFASEPRFYQRLRKQVRRRMRKVARDLARHLPRAADSPAAPRASLAKLHALFPKAPLMVGVTRRVQTRHKDPEGHTLHVHAPKRGTLTLRFAALVPTRLDADTPTRHRAAPFVPSLGAFLLHGMTPAALSAFEARANTTAAAAAAALPPYAASPFPLHSEHHTEWSSVDSVGFCAEAGCNGADLGFTACDLASGCDGADGCDIGGCDL